MRDSVVLTGQDVLFLRSLSPSDREVSFSLRFDRRGVSVRRLSGMSATEGDECSGEDCSVAPGADEVCAHTHPRGERVSSADLLVAVSRHPRFGGARRLSMVIAPKGLYSYAPSERLLGVWAEQDVATLWKFKAYLQWVGHQLQEDTQRGDVREFLAFLRGLGFDVSYVPYASIRPPDSLVFGLSSGS